MRIAHQICFIKISDVNRSVRASVGPDRWVSKFLKGDQEYEIKFSHFLPHSGISKPIGRDQPKKKTSKA
jgi:hypothetical protein